VHFINWPTTVCCSSVARAFLAITTRFEHNSNAALIDIMSAESRELQLEQKEEPKTDVNEFNSYTALPTPYVDVPKPFQVQAEKIRFS
jgi:hypothetical protein